MPNLPPGLPLSNLASEPFRLTPSTRPGDRPLAKPNYAFAKRQRDAAKKQKKEAKRLKKAEGQAPGDEKVDTPQPEEKVAP